MKRRIIKYIFFFAIMILYSPIAGHATEGDVGFSVKAVIPDNQVNMDKSYFDLRMKPNQEQVIEVYIYNNSHEDITVKASINNATTNRNGIIVYEKDSSQDPSLKTPLSSIVTLTNDEIEIPANGSEVVTATIKMPVEEYDGIILGGLHFEKVNDEGDQAQGVQIQNQYAYVIGVQLSENDHEVEPLLHLRSIEPKLVNYRTAVVANIQNSQPLILNNLSVHGVVYKKGETDVLHETKKKNISMAPNSNMNFVIDWENQKLEEGAYLLKMKAQLGEHQWEWEEEFTIEKAEESLNEEAVELETDETQWYKVGIILLSIIILILLYVIIRLKRKAR